MLKKFLFLLFDSSRWLCSGVGAVGVVGIAALICKVALAAQTPSAGPSVILPKECLAEKRLKATRIKYPMKKTTHKTVQWYGLKSGFVTNCESKGELDIIQPTYQQKIDMAVEALKSTPYKDFTPIVGFEPDSVNWQAKWSLRTGGNYPVGELIDKCPDVPGEGQNDVYVEFEGSRMQEHQCNTLADCMKMTDPANDRTPYAYNIGLALAAWGKFYKCRESAEWSKKYPPPGEDGWFDSTAFGAGQPVGATPPSSGKDPAAILNHDYTKKGAQ